MSIRKYKPYTSSTRNRSVSKFDNISSGKNKVFSTGFGNKSTIFSKTKIKPEKSLTSWVHRSKGRNNRGIITSRHIGGGHKKLYRKIDFKRTKIGIPGRVICIEYDPNRNSYIALLHYTDGDKKYIICPDNLKLGEIILADIDAPLIIGNSLPLLKIPLGTEIHNIELYPGSGGQLVRAAGTFAKLTAKKNNFVTLTLPSKEMRDVPNNCWATIGQVGNIDFNNLKVGKAGRKRWLGKRPHVRGVVMNPVDHPHGGGEGRAPIGRSHPVTPWGKPTLGHRTRKSKKYSQRFIVRRRF